MSGAEAVRWVVRVVVGIALLGPVTACERDEPVTDPETLTLDSPFRYPIELWDEGVEGETVVMVHVTDTGGVDSVYVQRTSGHAAFDSAAVEGARQLRFAPGRRGDRRISMWARLPVRFRMPADSMDTGGA